MIFRPMQVRQYQFTQRKFANYELIELVVVRGWFGQVRLGELANLHGWQTCMVGELVRLANLHQTKNHGIVSAERLNGMIMRTSFIARRKPSHLKFYDDSTYIIGRQRLMTNRLWDISDFTFD